MMFIIDFTAIIQLNGRRELLQIYYKIQHVA